MNTTTLTTAAGRSPRRPQREPGRSRLSLSSLLGGVAATVIAAFLVLTPSSASAATAGWRYYDTNGDRYSETALYFDGYGRATRVVMDTNVDRAWDIDGSIDANSAAWTVIRFDTNYNGTWDSRVSWYGTGTRYTAILSNLSTEFDDNWDELSLGNGQVRCYQQNARWPGSAQQRDSVFGIWWATCITGSSGSPLSGLITRPIYTNMFDALYRATGVAPAAHCIYYPNDSSCR